MFSSKIPMQKIFAYFFIGFISFLLILFFVGTDIISSFGGGSIDPNVIAIVNGQRLYRIDFIRYRDSHYRDSEMDTRENEKRILDSMIADVLFNQRARKLGVDPTEDLVIKEIQENFRDKKTGVFDSERLKEYLERTHTTAAEIHRVFRKGVINTEFRKLILMGFAFSPDDVLTEFRFMKSQCQIQYAYISADDLKKRLQDKITPTELELSTEMDKNKKTYTDQAMNRTMSLKNLADRKFSNAVNGIIGQINQLAKKGGSFAEAAGLLGGRPGISNTFILDQPVKDAAGRELKAFTNNLIFMEDCIFTGPQKTSKVYISEDGLYIFTPLRVALAQGEPTEAEYASIVEKLSFAGFNTAYSKLIENQILESKITKNLKTN